MKSISFQIGRVCILSLCLVFAFSYNLPAQPKAKAGKWEKLGQRTVNRSLDRDEIVVTAKEGRFSKVRLGVRKSGINMHKMVIHFTNGSKQEVAIRKNISAGGTTRVIDINGGKRFIKKVVFWYDTKGLINNKAIVEVWGRH